MKGMLLVDAVDEVLRTELGWGRAKLRPLLAQTIWREIREDAFDGILTIKYRSRRQTTSPKLEPNV